MNAKEVRDKFNELEERVELLEKENGSPTAITLQKLIERIGELELEVQMLKNKNSKSLWYRLKFVCF